MVGALLAAADGGPLGTARQLAAALAERALSECEALALGQDALVRVIPVVSFVLFAASCMSSAASGPSGLCRLGMRV